MKKHYCPKDGSELIVSKEKNRYMLGSSGGDFLAGEDYDKESGERLYCIVGFCPVKKMTWFNKEKSHYNYLIRRDTPESLANKMLSE